MAIAKINGVSEGNIAKIDGVSKDSVAKVSGVEIGGAAGPTHWVAVLQEGNVAWAASTALSGNANWTEYDNTDSTGHPYGYDIAYGRNNSGNPIYVCSRDSSSRELQVSGEDVTTTHDWTAVNLGPSADQFIVRWAASSSGGAAGVWMCGGQISGKLFRSTDGAQTFSQVVPSGLSSENIVGLASDGTGKWAFGNDNKFFISTDDGASFTSSTPWSSGGTPGYHRGLVYTNNSWVVIYSRSSTIYVRSCAASDITDWGTEFQPTITYNCLTTDGSGTPNRTVYARNPGNTQKANAEGVSGDICMVVTADDAVFRFNVNGKTITNSSASHGIGGKYFPTDNTGTVDGQARQYIGVPNWNGSNTFQDITTDGNNLWVATCKNGDAYQSVDNGVTWTIIVDGFSVDDWNAIAAPATFPL